MTRANKLTSSGDIPATKSDVLQRVESNRVSAALNDDRVTLFYQPVVRSGYRNFVTFYEGLARIITPGGAVISAGQFMPFIENTPLGTLLDRQVLRLALRELATNADIRLSINMSVLSMEDGLWFSTLKSADPEICERLIIEITEGAAMSNVETTIAFMHRIRQQRCSVALDDFGVGRLPFGTSKTFCSTSSR